MEHVNCHKCGSEYDLKRVARDWRNEPHDTRCDVCGTVLNDRNRDYQDILIMTKRGKMALG